jgi:hypothetical protein
MHRITLSKIFLWFGDFFAFFSSFFISLVLLPLVNHSQVAFPKEELDEYIFIHLAISLAVYAGFGFVYATIHIESLFGLSLKRYFEPCLYFLL